MCAVFAVLLLVHLLWCNCYFVFVVIYAIVVKIVVVGVGVIITGIFVVICTVVLGDGFAVILSVTFVIFFCHDYYCI